MATRLGFMVTVLGNPRQLRRFFLDIVDLVSREVLTMLNLFLFHGRGGVTYAMIRKINVKFN